MNNSLQIKRVLARSSLLLHAADPEVSATYQLLYRVRLGLRRRHQRCGAGVYSPLRDRQGVVKKIFVTDACGAFRLAGSGSWSSKELETESARSPSHSSCPDGFCRRTGRACL